MVLAGRYRLDHEISSGTVTSVWRAFDEVLRREVIAKILKSTDPEVSTQFRRASLQAAGLSHSNIARIYDTGEHEGRPWLVMELLEGGMLAEGASTAAPIANLGAGVCAALAHAHDLGMVHGGINESNVGFTESGYPKVVDFGTSYAALAQSLSGLGPLPRPLNRPKVGSGERTTYKDKTIEDGRERTRGLLEPEGLSPETDLRDLGRMLYRLATGREPAEPARNPRDLKPELPRPLARAIMTALGEGFASAREFEAALRVITDDTTPPPARWGAGITEPVARVASAPRQSFLKTEGRWLVPVVLIVALAGGLVVSLPALREKISEVVGAGEPAPAAASLKAAPGGVYDPPPGDGAENNGKVRFAFDQDPDTAWQTSMYRTESFGNLKDGVGIYTDLGRPVSLAGLRITSERGGWSGTIRYSNDADSWSAPGQSQSASADQTFTTQGTHRYFMLWITRLVKASGGNGNGDEGGEDKGEGKGKDKNQNPYWVEIKEITAVTR